MTSPTVRVFAPDAWAAYRAVRLRALAADPGVFSSNHAAEATRPEAHWRGRLSDPNTGIFGVFADEQVVGMTGIWVPATALTDAVLWGSWLEPAWRGRGVSSAMYAARITWARAHPTAARVVVSHRESNQASRAANQRNGFVFTHARDAQWPDGASEPELFYALALR